MSEELANTPTKANTKLNSALSRETSMEDEEEDHPLRGPLNMPELPSTPGEDHFTMDMLTARLRAIEEHPEENEPLALLACGNRRESVVDSEAVKTFTYVV